MKYLGSYQEYLRWNDRLTSDTLRFAPAAGAGNDDFRSDLAGFLATAYVASFESCIRTLFLAFARSKHKMLATVAEFHFDRLSGNIGIDDIANKYAKQFGVHYKAQFKKIVEEIDTLELTASGQSVKTSYKNLIIWRNKFAHEGVKLATIEEVIAAEAIGRKVISALDNAMSSRKTR